MAHCSCKKFEGEGIPCRHILCLLKGLDELPSYYIVNRWTKMTASRPIYDLEGNILEGCSQIDNEEELIRSNWLDFLNCMEVAGREVDKQVIVSKALKEALRELGESSGHARESKTRVLESFIGSSAP